jgi:Pectinacetylesterase
MRSSRFVAMFAAATAALATVGAALGTVGAVGATAPPTSEPSLDEAALEFAQCMRDNGIEEFADPQIGADGGISLRPPTEVGSEELATAEAVCGHILDETGWPRDPFGSLATDIDAPGGPVTAANSEWDKVVPGGDCMCADGSEFAFWERRADPTRVVFFLDGGGACTDAATCAFTGLSAGGEPAIYDWSIWGEDPATEGGIFDFAHADNPFAEHTFIYVPLCTGDGHLGDVTREYSPELTVEHNGLVNGTAALSYLAAHYPDATQVVVVGKVDGSVAAPLYGGLVADLLPGAEVTVLGADSGHIPDDPDRNAEFGELWGAYDNLPDWEVNQGLTARDLGPPRLWIQAGLHDPDIVLARFDFAYDAEAAEGAELFGLDPSDLLAVIDANEAAIEDAGVVLHSYTAPGDGHTILENETFYEVEVNDVRLVDWVDALITGQPLADVHCDRCETA